MDFKDNFEQTFKKWKRPKKTDNRGNIEGLAKYIAHRVGGDPHLWTKCMEFEKLQGYDHEARAAICARVHKIVTGYWTREKKPEGWSPDDNLIKYDPSKKEFEDKFVEAWKGGKGSGNFGHGGLAGVHGGSSPTTDSSGIPEMSGWEWAKESLNVELMGENKQEAFNELMTSLYGKTMRPEISDDTYGVGDKFILTPDRKFIHPGEDAGNYKGKYATHTMMYAYMAVSGFEQNLSESDIDKSKKFLFVMESPSVEQPFLEKGYISVNLIKDPWGTVKTSIKTSIKLSPTKLASQVKFIAEELRHTLFGEKIGDILVAWQDSNNSSFVQIKIDEIDLLKSFVTRDGRTTAVFKELSELSLKENLSQKLKEKIAEKGGQGSGNWGHGGLQGTWGGSSPKVKINNAYEFVSRFADVEPATRGRKKEIQEAIFHGLDLIDEVHKCDSCRRFPIKIINSSSSTAARIKRYASNHITMCIEVNQQSTELSAERPVDFIHEMGHYFTLTADGSPKQTPETKKAMDDLIDALKKTSYVKKLKDLYNHPEKYPRNKNYDNSWVGDYRLRQHLRYLMDEEELIARSYAQYILQKTNHNGLSKWLKEATKSDPVYGINFKTKSAKSYSMSFQMQWKQNDFAPVMDAWDNYLRSVGWLNE